MTEIDTLTKLDYTGGRYEWERFASKVAGPLVASVIQPIWQSVASSDTVESVSQIHSSSAITTRPQLDPPPPMDQGTFELAKAGLTNFVEADKQKSTLIDVDELVHEILMTLAQDSNDYLLAKRSFFDLERKWSDTKENERTTELQNQVAATNTVNSWGKVEQSLVSVGLIATGILGLAAGDVTGLSLTAVTIGSLLLVDQLLDDTVKKTVAGWLARGNREETANWVNRIQMFCGLSSFALSLGINPNTAVQVAMNVAKGVVDVTKGALEWRLSLQKANVMQLDADSKQAQKSVDTLFTEIQEICNTIFQFHENIHHIEEKRQQIAHSMLRFAEA